MAIAKAAAHGVTSGIASEMQGGKFSTGFASSFAAAAFIPEGTANSSQDYARAVRAAIGGGTVAEIGGGKFENDAVTGAFQFLFNGVASAEKDSSASEKDYTALFDEQLKETAAAFRVASDKISDNYQPLLDVALRNEGPNAYSNILGRMNAERLEVFRSMVTDGACYDLTTNRKLPYNIDSMAGPTALYHGKSFTPNDFGNYNYGVAAKAFGLSRFTAQYIGGDGNQILKSFGFDTNRAQTMIESGFNHVF